MTKARFIIFILITTIIGGLNFPMGKLGLEFSSPLLLMAVRFIGAGLIMLPFILKRPHPKTWHGWLQIAIIGLFQSAFVMGGIILSMKTITSSSSSILSSTNPIWSIVIGSICFGLRYHKYQWLGVFIGFVGVFITLGFHFQLQIGTVYGLLAGVAWGLATLLSGRWGKALDVWVMTAYQMFFGGLVLLLASLLMEHPYFSFEHVSVAKAVFVLLWLIFVSSIAMFAIWFYVLQHYDPQKASSYLFLIPFFGVVSSYLILGESIQWYVLVGGGMIALGIYLVNRSKPAKSPDRKPGLKTKCQRVAPMVKCEER
ncbi:DMT family transporter [Fictibacillus sp. Mic-4]|uniref:DMT family transporter n=1 Tax=Fictibacillus sp. Mic-4 TaxID=3132826 RepID=UPI003CE6FA6D